MNTQEMTIATRLHYMSDGGKAWDLAYSVSALLERLLKQKKGIYQKHPGGRKLRVPFKFNKAVGGTFTRGGSLSSDDRELVDGADFSPKSYYGNGTIYWQDELDNSGEEAMIDMIRERADSAKKRPMMDLAGDIWGMAGDTDEEILGLASVCADSSSFDVGEQSEDDVVAADGTKPWYGVTNSTSTVIGPSTMRALIASAIRTEGAENEPNFGAMTRTLFNAFKDVLTPLQTLTEDSGTTKAGFQNLVFDGVTLVPDGYAPSGYIGLINDRTVGFSVHKKGDFVMVPWESTHINNVMAKTMKILFYGMFITNDRASNALATAFTS